MSKRKLLINEVFEQAKRESGKTSKSGLALYLKVHLETFKIFFDEKTFSRYYDAYVLEIREEINLDTDTIDKLSRYIGFKNFSDFSNTFIKRNEDANFTEIKVNVDGNELSSPKAFSDVNINITNINKSNFPVKDFITKNGLGLLEITFVLLLVTGGVIFSNGKKDDNKPSFNLGFLSNWKPDVEKNYMYWSGERFYATDSNYISPEFDVVAMDKKIFQNQRKITRKDTMTLANSLGKVWCSKWNNEVDFFTMDGLNPDNGRELKLASDHMILKYAGKQEDSIQVPE